MTDLAPKTGISESVEVAGCAFHCVRSGAGPPVVLVHGGPGLWDYLGPVAALIERRARAFRYDQRACGRSTGEGPHTIARHVADLEALRDHWGLERFTVIGHSWGASLALHYALEHPERLAGMVYMSGTGVDPAWKADNKAARPKGRLVPSRPPASPPGAPTTPTSRPAANTPAPCWRRACG